MEANSYLETVWSYKNKNKVLVNMHLSKKIKAWKQQIQFKELEMFVIP